MLGGRDTVTSGKTGKFSRGEGEIIRELSLYYPSHICLDLNKPFKIQLKHNFLEKVFTASKTYLGAL